MTVAQIITNEIIKRLQEGDIPWVRTWNTGNPISHSTGREYTGINALLLPQGEYVTYNQMKEEGGHLKKGAKSHIVAFYKSYEVTDSEEEEPEQRFVLRYYRVFNLKDTEGITPKHTSDTMNNKPIDEPQRVIDTYIKREHITLQDDAFSNEAFYSATDDIICVPTITQHINSAEFYCTLFHEMVHSTGHHKRLNRNLTGKAQYSQKSYSREELTAEIGAAMLMRITGADTPQTLKNNAAYCQSWIKYLKDDANAILVAAAKSEKAVDYILHG